MPTRPVDWSWSRGWAIVAALLLVVEAGANAYFNALDQQWLGMALAASLPLAAGYTWWTRRSLGPEVAAVADNMLVYVMFALGLYAWVIWP